MARRRDPATNRLLMEGVHPVVSERTGAVTYRARYSWGSGDHRQHASKTFKTAHAAEEWLSGIQSDVRRGVRVDTSTITVADYYAQWFGRMSTQWSGSRTRTVRMVWERYAAPYFGTMKLQAVTRPDVQRFADQLVASKLKATTVHIYMVGIVSLFDAAMDDGIIPRNPAHGITLPKREVKHRPIWSPLQIRRFLSLTKDDPYGPIWAFIVATGCRRGEALALAWDALDLDTGTVWIRRTVARRPDGNYEIRNGTKRSDTGHMVRLEPWIVDILRAHQATRKGELVFHDDGEMIPPGTLGWNWTRSVRESGLPPIRLHDLRHSVASAMVASGVGDGVIKSILGHASIRTTMDTYAHVKLEGQQLGTNAMSRLLGFEDSEGATTDNEKARS